MPALVLATVPVLAAAAAFEPPRRADVCVTEGSLRASGTELVVEDAGMRAVFLGSDPDHVEIDFVYLGTTEDVSRLASGRVAHQFGLKLRALDSCNVVYVMWAADREPGLEVSIKSNPGKRLHAQCGVHGYRSLAATESTPLPPLEPGSRHRLEAGIDADVLSVRVDEKLVWKGPVPSGEPAAGSHPGLRSDNVRLRLNAGIRARGISASGLVERPNCHPVND
ncbi:hypothetical protein LOC51_27615 [Rubrivivax sp. JA1024]|nr:hypothetical protein [Rubrivivax sp. JA1024]